MLARLEDHDVFVGDVVDETVGVVDAPGARIMDVSETGPFFHVTTADLRVGDLLTTGRA